MSIDLWSFLVGADIVLASMLVATLAYHLNRSRSAGSGGADAQDGYGGPTTSRPAPFEG